ncbi:AAA domain-containing protein [Pilaira anomala]|nr:AAA domain-containing protein [Pilaira anomala]
MLVLVGLPGSGKTTISSHLVKYKQEWQRINQDDMRSRKACEMYTRKFLDEKYSVVVDRCNFDREQRKTWIELAEHYKIPVDCIVLTTNQEECYQRIKARTEHPTGVIGKEGTYILKRFVKNYHPPQLDHPEGFERILFLDPSPTMECTDERIDEIFRLLDASPNLLRNQQNPPTERTPSKPKITVDEEGWSTVN